MQNPTQIKDIDIGNFWKAIGCRAIGAAVVTAQGDTGPAGFLALSTSHLCASPPILMVSVGLDTSASAVIVESGSFAINFLPKDRKDLSDSFGGKGPLKGADRFGPGEWNTLATGAPTLKDAVGVLDCRVEECIERHRTLIVLGRLVSYALVTERDPLIFFAGRMD